MEPSGWLLLLTSWVSLSAGVYYCLRRVLQEEAAARAERPRDEAPPE